MEGQSNGKRVGKMEQFWMEIRKILESKPNEVILVTTYNHPTLAYRARRDIISGLNPVFPESHLWKATVVKDGKSAYYGPRSGKLTYKHELYMAYTPGAN